MAASKRSTQPAPNALRTGERFVVNCMRKLTEEGKLQLALFAEALALARINRRRTSRKAHHG